MTTHPHVPAGFINTIAEEGTKEEAVAFLQRQWNETCALRRINAEMLKTLRNLVGLAEMRGGKLHEYKAALDDARAAIAKAEGRS